MHTHKLESGEIITHTHEDLHEHGEEHMHVHSHHGHTHSHTQTKNVINRLAKAIGHLESVKRMVEDGRDCSEVLTQLAAVRSALNSTAKVILQDHIEHCLLDAAKEDNTDALDELCKAIQQFIK